VAGWHRLPTRPDQPGPPAALAAHTPRVIRDALTGRERVDFERRYADEMSIAAATLDLTGVLAVLDTFRTIAEITQRQGPEAHQHMLDQIDPSSAVITLPRCPGTITRQRSAGGRAADLVYSYEILPEARDQVEGIPAAALHH
jgi:hypothetical protein